MWSKLVSPKKTTFTTPGVMEKADPSQWSKHHFGLTPERWSRLNQKSIWITGAGTGYGRSLAIALAAAGARVFLSGRRIEKLQETLQEMKAYGIDATQAVCVPCDLQETSSMESACQSIQQQSSSLYALIHSAAVPPSSHAFPLIEDSLSQWQDMLSVNVTAPWFLTRTILPHMAKGNEARILFLTSEAGWAFTSGFGPYNLTKAALNNLMGSFAEECKAHWPKIDMQVNALNPGEARSQMNQTSSVSPYAAASMALTLLSHPAKGPNGKFFHRDGRHLNFTYAASYDKPLM